MNGFKTFLYKIIFLAIMITIAVSCSDDIYYKIYDEPPLIPPMIKGSPTNFVVFNSEMYVAAGKNLYIYNETDKSWKKKTIKFEDTSYNITQLARTDTRVYALCFIDKDASVVRKILWSDAAKIAADNWEEIPKFNTAAAEKYSIAQSIYSADNKLYIGAQFSGDSSKESEKLNEYAVHVLDSNHNTEAPVFSGENYAILYGAVYDGATTYICTSNGIFARALNDNSAGANPMEVVKVKSEVNNFIGIISLPDGSVAAINRGGTLYKIENLTETVCGSENCDNKEDLGSDKTTCPDCGGDVVEVKITKTKKIVSLPNERWASGAIALWKDINNSSNQLLLVGRQDREYTTTTGYTYGYMELELDSSGSIPETSVFQEPGVGNITTVHNNTRYASSLGILPINHMYQSKVNGILFASTHQSGVWSYKERNKEFLWNSEE